MGRFIIKEHFQVEDTDTLSKEQIEELSQNIKLLTDSPSKIIYSW